MAGVMLWNWYHPKEGASSPQWTPAPQIKEVVKIKRVEVPGPEKIITIEKERVVQEIGLPESISTDPYKQVVATATIPPYKGQTDVVAITDTQSGASEITTKQKPLPLFGFPNEKELGARVGIGTSGEKMMDIYGRWTFFRVGSWHLGIYGEGTATDRQETRGKASLDVSYRW